MHLPRASLLVLLLLLSQNESIVINIDRIHRRRQTQTDTIEQLRVYEQILAGGFIEPQLHCADVKFW